MAERNMRVRADEVLVGDLANLDGYTVTVERVEPFSSFATRISWRATGMVPVGETVLRNSVPVHIARG